MDVALADGRLKSRKKHMLYISGVLTNSDLDLGCRVKSRRVRMDQQHLPFSSHGVKRCDTRADPPHRNNMHTQIDTGGIPTCRKDERCCLILAVDHQVVFGWIG